MLNFMHMNIIQLSTLGQITRALFHIKPKPVVANSRHHLKNLIIKQIQTYGAGCDLNHIDVSQVTDMRELFAETNFNGDISGWNTARVRDMSSMFYHSTFNGDISKWDVSSVRNISRMFELSSFNGDLSLWNTEKVQNMAYMFFKSDFNGDVSRWDTSKAIDMVSIFSGSPFRGDVSKWVIQPQCRIEDAAPAHYGSSPLFLACAHAAQQDKVPDLEPYYSKVMPVVNSLGIEEIEAGQALFQMIHQMRYGQDLSLEYGCDLHDFS